MTWQAKRYHDISCGHRVVGHENKCRYLHGHNYRIHFICESDKLDNLGRVIDFGEIKSRLCFWLEDNWDHKFLAWESDRLMRELFAGSDEDNRLLNASVIFVPFNPTAENMAQYLVEVIGPRQLEGTGIKLVECTVDETQKCSGSYKIINPCDCCKPLLL